MYLSEIAPRKIQGGVGVVFQLSCVLAILVSQILGYESVLGTADLWPVLLNMNLVLGLIQCLTLPFCPASPRYYHQIVPSIYDEFLHLSLADINN